MDAVSTFFSDFGIWVKLVVLNWWTLVGTIISVVVWVIEKALRITISYRLIITVFAAALLLAAFQSWRDEYQRPEPVASIVGSDLVANAHVTLNRRRAFGVMPVLIIQIKNRGDASSFSNFQIHATVNHEPEVFATIKPINRNVCVSVKAGTILFGPSDDINVRSARVTEHGGRLDGVLYGFLPGATPSNLDMTSIWVEFTDDASGKTYKATPANDAGLFRPLPNVGTVIAASKCPKDYYGSE